MDPDTRRALAAVNRRFYDEEAGAFDATRSAPWRGWRRLVEEVDGSLSAGRRLRVLDVGCGNGRFGSVVQERMEARARPWSYLGLDGSEALLQAAGERLEGLPALELRTWDLLTTPLTEAAPGDFELVALFGLLHHVPGREERRQLLLDAAARLAPGGFLAFTVWRFGEDPRFRRRRASWEEAEVEEGGLDAGDFLLRWGNPPRALRYCHAADEGEQLEWIAGLESGGDEAARLKTVLRFDADGKSGKLNRYYLLRREGTG